MTSEEEILNEFDQLIKTRNLEGLLPFLREKSEGHIEALRKHLIKAKRYWMTHIEVAKEPAFSHRGSPGSWATRGDHEQCALIILSAIAVMDKKGIDSWDEPISIFNESSKHAVLLDVLKWSQPDWLGTYILDKIKRNDWLSINYRTLRLLEAHQFIAYNPELFALSLSSPLSLQYREANSKKEIHGMLDGFLADELTYKRDIPELFNYETSLHHRAVYYRTNNQHTSFPIWEYLYTELLASKKMTLSFFIENALRIQTKDWNNNLKSFFRKQVAALNLLPEELLPFQDIIFTLFHVPYLPVVNYGVDLCKQLYDTPGFKVAAFLEWISAIMMRADFKGAIKSLLPILEKIAKSNSAEQANIAEVLADVFVIPDLALQERVAKILLKLGEFHNENFKEKITLYIPQMQGNVKNLLHKWLAEDVAASEEIVVYQQISTPTKLLQEPLNLPDNWNDILFQVGKFIHSEEPQEAEILLNTFICKRHLFPEDYPVQLGSYSKQLSKSDFDPLFKREMQAFLLSKIQDLNAPYSREKDYKTELEALLIFCKLTRLADRKMRQDSTLPLLSLPTHHPNWIAPKVLLERIVAHQQKGEGIDLADLSIAIARMPREEVADALPLLEQIDESMQPLLRFCLGVDTSLQLPEKTRLPRWMNWITGNSKDDDFLALWAVAGRTYYPQQVFLEFEKTYLRDVAFVVRPFQPQIYFKERWNEWKRPVTQTIERTPSWYELHFKKPDFQKTPDFLLYSLNLYRGGDGWWTSLDYPANVFYWHSIMPQNAEPLAIRLMTTACTLSEDDNTHLKGFLQLFYRPEFWFSDSIYLCFACCFFKQKKDVRLVATEVLLHLIEQRRLDAYAFGAKIALLISEKYGALGRWIDVLITLKDISPLYNAALFMLLDTGFKHMTIADKFPPHFKKLLECYLDIVVKTGEKPSPGARTVLEKWQENTAFKKLIKQLLNS